MTTIKYADILGAAIIGTISQQEMARLVRTLGTYIADAPEQSFRIGIGPTSRLYLGIGDGATHAALDITDCEIHIK
jgi:hypothetical protein